MRAVPEKDRWKGEGVHIEQVSAELERRHRGLHRDGPGRALARNLNLVVAPTSAPGVKLVDEALAGLRSHSPSRTLVLRRHQPDRLDAEVVIECEMPDAPGSVGVYHDFVVLTADESRLEHAASLLAPLLMTDLPTVLWLPEPDSPVQDPRLFDRAQQVLLDSTTADGDDLRRVAGLTRESRVQDLAWGRLEFWRAATAAAFEPPERRALLPEITGLEIRHQGDGYSAGLLLAGWIAARAGWRPGPVERDDGRAHGQATRADGSGVQVSLTHDQHAQGCGGIEALTFKAASDEVKIGRGAATSRLRDLFAEALQPTPTFARGYADALGAAVAMVGD